MDPEIAAFHIDDLCAATFTPYKEDGSVALELIDAHAKDLVDHGIRYAFVNGTTGDSMVLSVPERKALTEAWVAAGKAHGMVIIAHIGTASIEETMDLARHAQAVGCAAISSMPPVFFKPATPALLAAWLRKVSDAAPKMPLYYYHFPAITGVTLDPLAIIQACEAAGVRTFRGMKFTEFNLWHYENCVRHGDGRYDMCYGRDEAMLGGLAIGAKASIGNGFNMAPGVYQRLRKAWFAGDLPGARAEQRRANQVVNLMFDAKYGGNGLSAARIIYELKSGIPIGPPREPLVRLSPATAKALEDDLRAIGFFEWCN